MQGLKINQPTIQGQLKAKRNLLFEEFLGNPSNIRLAIEIRSIDDRIAELTGHLTAEQKPDAD
jgi:hypothetical protein